MAQSTIKQPAPRDAQAAILRGAERRAAKYHTEYVQRLGPDYTRPYILGSYSLTSAKAHKRQVLAPLAVDVGGGLLESPSAIARDYLAWRWGRGPIWVSEQEDHYKEEAYHMPMFAAPCYFDYGEYIDIRSAWWSILSVIGWNTDIWPGRWWRFGELPTDWPYPQNSRARNCLVSTPLSRSVRWWRPELGKVVAVPSFNRLYNRSLYVAISCVLTSIAIECRNVGACYWNTDGAIAPSAAIAQAVEDVIIAWGLTTSVKHKGAGYVASVGHYRFTDMAKPRSTWGCHKSDNMNAVNVGWVKSHWVRCWAQRRICQEPARTPYAIQREASKCATQSKN
jgi:hypothetical protein